MQRIGRHLGVGRHPLAQNSSRQRHSNTRLPQTMVHLYSRNTNNSKRFLAGFFQSTRHRQWAKVITKVMPQVRCWSNSRPKSPLLNHNKTITATVRAKRKINSRAGLECPQRMQSSVQQLITVRIWIKVQLPIPSTLNKGNGIRLWLWDSHHHSSSLSPQSQTICSIAISDDTCLPTNF